MGHYVIHPINAEDMSSIRVVPYWHEGAIEVLETVRGCNMVYGHQCRETFEARKSYTSIKTPGGRRCDGETLHLAGSGQPRLVYLVLSVHFIHPCLFGPS